MISSKRLFSVQNLFYGLLFLFPIAGNSIKSWTSAIYWSLFIVSLFLFRTSRCLKSEFHPREKLVLVSIVGIFVAMLISSTFAGWGYQQIKGLDVQFRYLAFLPIYFAFRFGRGGIDWLTKGMLIGSLVLLGQAIYDIEVLELERAYGMYGSPGLFAFQALIYGLFLVRAGIRCSRHIMFINFFGAIVCFIALLLSGSRSTYFTVLAATPVILLVFFSRRVRIYSAIFLLTILPILYLAIPPVHHQVNKAVDEVSAYFSNHKADEKWEDGSVAARFAMWHAALVIAKDNPIVGIGWRNFSDFSAAYADAGLIAPEGSRHPHPHNTYLEFLVTNGLIGFILLCALLVSSYRTRTADNSQNITQDVWLKVFIVFFAINAINEGGAIIYGNSAAFFFVAFGALLASCYQSKGFLKPSSH